MVGRDASNGGSGVVEMTSGHASLSENECSAQNKIAEVSAPAFPVPDLHLSGLHERI
jgi:hypothetical protein